MKNTIPDSNDIYDIDDKYVDSDAVNSHIWSRISFSNINQTVVENINDYNLETNNVKKVDSDMMYIKNQYIGTINNFYTFRKRINRIDDIDINMVLHHKDCVNLDSNIIDLKTLIYNSISYYNSILANRKAHVRKSYIKLDSCDINKLCNEYLKADNMYKAYHNKCDFNIHLLQNHDVTKFITKLILFYLYNELFAQKIKDYRLYHGEVTDVTFMAIIYMKLIQFCISFDNCISLQLR